MTFENVLRILHGIRILSCLRPGGHHAGVYRAEDYPWSHQYLPQPRASTLHFRNLDSMDAKNTTMLAIWCEMKNKLPTPFFSACSLHVSSAAQRTPIRNGNIKTQGQAHIVEQLLSDEPPAHPRAARPGRPSRHCAPRRRQRRPGEVDGARPARQRDRVDRTVRGGETTAKKSVRGQEKGSEKASEKVKGQ